ncbi:hypothetical protein SAMN05444678_101310 [Sphingomonas sp. YR710]|uniref:hypothetical protein n=1 Tax=Sphingomonas sp. YR710 TaxID=1882773 RepID=UPI00088B35F8|nr:hypothetical protein [Sphingomonas sp. YR710]SDC08247.1 hypothetical protein SAMN05444678_101310 [Sphingomonas sp. YR710]
MKILGGHATAMGVALVLTSAAQPTAAKIIPSIDTTVRLGYDTNPFLSQGNDLATGSAKVDVKPALSYVTPTGQAVLTGDYERSQYQQHYGHTDQYGGTLDLRKRFNPKFDAFVALRYDSSVIGQSDDVVAQSPSAPPTDQTDVNLIGQRQRSNVYSAQAGFNYVVGPKDTVSVDGGITLTRFPGRGLGSASDNYGGRVALSHAISAKTKIGVSSSVYRIVYDIAGFNTLVAQPTVTFSTQLSPTWNLDLAAGVSISDIVLPGPGNDSRTVGFAGNVSLCHAGRTNHFCLSGSRTVSGSGLGGSSQRNQVGLHFDQDLTPTLSADANASVTQSKSQSKAIGNRDYVSVQAGLTKKVTRRFKVGVDGRYRDVFGSGTKVKADVGGEVNATLILPGPS